MPHQVDYRLATQYESVFLSYTKVRGLVRKVSLFAVDLRQTQSHCACVRLSHIAAYPSVFIKSTRSLGGQGLRGKPVVNSAMRGS
jgi:hypothetical protein